MMALRVTFVTIRELRACGLEKYMVPSRAQVFFRVRDSLQDSPAHWRCYLILLQKNSGPALLKKSFSNLGGGGQVGRSGSEREPRLEYDGEVRVRPRVCRGK